MLVLTDGIINSFFTKIDPLERLALHELSKRTECFPDERWQFCSVRRRVEGPDQVVVGGQGEELDVVGSFGLGVVVTEDELSRLGQELEVELIHGTLDREQLPNSGLMCLSDRRFLDSAGGLHEGTGEPVRDVVGSDARDCGDVTIGALLEELPQLPLARLAARGGRGLDRDGGALPGQVATVDAEEHLGLLVGDDVGSAVLGRVGECSENMTTRHSCEMYLKM